MEVRLSGCLVLPSNDSWEGPISYASEFLVIFLPWYNCCVYVLNGNKMLLNWIWIENQVTRQLHLHDPNCITLALIHHCVGAMGLCCCVLPWWKCRGPESSQRWGLAVTMGTVSVCTDIGKSTGPRSSTNENSGGPMKTLIVPVLLSGKKFQ